MAYTPHAPPFIEIEDARPDIYVGSTISEKAVTPVTEVTEILAMPLGRFATEGRALEVRVPWLQETLWFAPGLGQVGRLMERGVQRGRIWTAGELGDLASIGYGSREAVSTLARIKVALGAELVSVSVPPAAGETDAGDEPGEE